MEILLTRWVTLDPHEVLLELLCSRGEYIQGGLFWSMNLHTISLLWPKKLPFQQSFLHQQIRGCSWSCLGWFCQGFGGGWGQFALTNLAEGPSSGKCLNQSSSASFYKSLTFPLLMQQRYVGANPARKSLGVWQETTIIQQFVGKWGLAQPEYVGDWGPAPCEGAHQRAYPQP